MYRMRDMRAGVSAESGPGGQDICHRRRTLPAMRAMRTEVSGRCGRAAASLMLSLIHISMCLFALSFLIISFSGSLPLFLVAAVVSAFGYGAAQPDVYKRQEATYDRDKESK